jgi:hypothetical protein
VAATSLGWTLQVRAPLAAVLVVNFFVGLGSGTNNTGTLESLSRYRVAADCQLRSTAKTSHQGKAAQCLLLYVSPLLFFTMTENLTWQLNLLRCLFGAVGTSVIQLLYSSALGAGWTFGDLCACVPIYYPPGPASRVGMEGTENRETGRKGQKGIACHGGRIVVRIHLHSTCCCSMIMIVCTS